MNKPNYNYIAADYDTSTLRDKTADGVLAAFISKNRSSEGFKICDIGCGTGTWVHKNSEVLQNFGIEWFGADASQAMLDQASAKFKEAKWFCAKADVLPFQANYFDYLNSEYAFHHFENKSESFEELNRVLKPKGWMVLRNHDPFESHYDLADFLFPTVRERNQSRFLQVNDLVALLEKAGFGDIQIERSEFPASTKQNFEDYLEVLRRRTISNLWLIDEAEYRSGIEKLEKTMAEAPETLRQHFQNEKTVHLTIKSFKSA